MTQAEYLAQSLIRTYLNGRTMPEDMFEAVVWVAAQRLTGRRMPVLDETLRQDIDSQATSPPGEAYGPVAALGQPVMCWVRSAEIEPQHDLGAAQ